MSASEEYLRDEWPTMPDGTAYDGKNLLTLTRIGNNPFHGLWNVNALIEELESNLDTRVVEIPMIFKGSNNYGIHFELSNRPDIIARLSRNDVNMPNFRGFPLERQVKECKFEAAVYELLCHEPDILASHLLYHRLPVQNVDPKVNAPQDIMGRSLLVFEKPKGENNVWKNIKSEEKTILLAQSARIRASLFNFKLPVEFAATWLLECLFEQKPKSLPISIASSREFCVALFESKIEATIGKVGEMIGWESDNATVGPIAAAAKKSILRLIPYILPTGGDEAILYRLVLEHGDFGIHNMSIAKDSNGNPLVTSLYDWETSCIWPSILSDPEMAVIVDLTVDESAGPKVVRVSKSATSKELAEYKAWAHQYTKVLFNEAPDYERVIKAGKDARHLWYALRAWRGEDPEGYFGKLGSWAESRMKDLGVN